jgi:hypothetical protein
VTGDFLQGTVYIYIILIIFVITNIEGADQVSPSLLALSSGVINVIAAPNSPRNALPEDGAASAWYIMIIDISSPLYY